MFLLFINLFPKSKRNYTIYYFLLALNTYLLLLFVNTERNSSHNIHFFLKKSVLIVYLWTAYTLIFNIKNTLINL